MLGVGNPQEQIIFISTETSDFSLGSQSPRPSSALPRISVGRELGPDPSSLPHMFLESLLQTRSCELVLLPEHQCGLLRDALFGSSLCCGGASMQVCLKHHLAVAKGGVSLAARWVRNVPLM